MGTFLSNHVARGEIAVRRFKFKGLCQSLNSLVIDKVIETSHCNLTPPLLLFDCSTTSPFKFKEDNRTLATAELLQRLGMIGSIDGRGWCCHKLMQPTVFTGCQE